ncbi:sodium/potassium/calcium exchanger 3-like, partial [Polyodon spathula]|uniref:sodium/potassium/calcium exchanger 3-like n=1 Tax=Polyodon spathula TaxID=7913 RepID=UPI001B7E371C
YNSQIHGFVEQRRPGGGQSQMVNGRSRDQGAEHSPHPDTSMVLLRKGRCSLSDSSPVLMVDELFCQQPHQLSFPETTLRIMITQHFSPRTRLSMAGRMLINERQRLIRTSSPGGSSRSGAGPETPVKDGAGGRAWPLENGGALDNERHLLEEPSERREEREGPAQREEERPLEGEEEEEGEEEGGVFHPFHIP